MLLVLRPYSAARLSLGFCFGRQVVLCLGTQSCPTLCDPMDCSPSDFSVMGFLRQENWSGLPFPSPGDLPNSWIEP